jgi:hypothetical protein
MLVYLGLSLAKFSSNITLIDTLCYQSASHELFGLHQRQICIGKPGRSGMLRLAWLGTGCVCALFVLADGKVVQTELVTS